MYTYIVHVKKFTLNGLYGCVSMYVFVKHMCFIKHHPFSDVLVTFKY